tara:strand:+ start:96 stop:359 length:264 start_codon:yes stop_codon:yes gene_type:complete
MVKIKDLITTEGTMTADGFDEAIIGTVERFGDSEAIVLYDKEKVIQILMKEMPREEAEEYFYYNIIGAYVGEGTPAFATIIKEKDER